MTQPSTFALLIYRTASGEPSPEAGRDALEGHRRLQRQARQDLHAVARLGPGTQARTVRVQRGAHQITDGPYIESKEWLVGFYLLECEDWQQALQRAREICPHADHAIEVRPVVWRWAP
jgi:hypothetical protein